MNHPYSQEELAAFYSEGRTVIVGFRSASEIKLSHGAGEYILCPIGKKQTGLPFTQRGRVQAITPELYQEILVTCIVSSNVA